MIYLRPLVFNRLPWICLAVFCLAGKLPARAGDGGTVLYPMDWVPAAETAADITRREARLVAQAGAYDQTLNQARSNGTLGAWFHLNYPEFASLVAESAKPSGDAKSEAHGKKHRGKPAATTAEHDEVDTEPDENSDYSKDAYAFAHRLLSLSRFSVERQYPELKPLLLPCIRAVFAQSKNMFLTERKKDLSGGSPRDKGRNGFPYDLNTTQPFNGMMVCAAAMKVLGEYRDGFQQETEQMLDGYIENKGQFAGEPFFSGGYNKEVFKMEIGGWVEYLYSGQPAKYPKSRKSFNSCWDGWMKRYGYDGDNSPHYDAGTGIPSLMRLAYFLGRTNDLMVRPDFHRIALRMANTVMNSGENAKWGKCMGARVSDPSRSLFVSAGPDLPWTLAYAYGLFHEPLLLYTARKYEERFWPQTGAHGNLAIPLYPPDIGQFGMTNVGFPADAPLSLATRRLTHVDGEKMANRIGRGDTKTALVQDKLILRTGTHPQSPYFLMDLSFSQSKNAPDHRIGIDNLIFDTVHLCTYQGRPGNGNQINQVFLSPTEYAYPLVHAPPGEVDPSDAYLEKLHRTADYKSYVLNRCAATNVESFAAYGVADYSKYQYSGVHVCRETVLLHNGVMVVLDTITADRTLKRALNAGVLYQIWPGIKSAAPDKSWVLQEDHVPTAPALARSPKGFPTLFYFPRTEPALECRLTKDPSNPSKIPVTVYSAHARLTAGTTLRIPSIIAPIRDASHVPQWIQNVAATVNGQEATIKLPLGNGDVSVHFRSDRPASVSLREASF